MENELCRSRTTRWADVEAEEDDLDMSLPVDRMSEMNISTSWSTDNDRSDSKRKTNTHTSSHGANSGTGGFGSGRHNKRMVNLPREAPFIAKVTNLDYSLQLQDIQKFFKSNGIEDIKVKLPMRGGSNEGVATVEFGNFDDFSKSVNSLDGLCIGSRNIRVNAVPQKNRMDDGRSGSRGGGGISRGGGGSGGAGTGYSSGGSMGGSQGGGFGSGGMRGGKNQSNRDPSPDFTIVRRMNPAKAEESSLKGGQSAGNSSSSSSSGPKPSSSGPKDSSFEKNKTVPKGRTGSAPDQSSSSSNTQHETSNANSKTAGACDTERVGAGGNRRWNLGASKERERSRYKQSANESGQFRTVRGGGKGGGFMGRDVGGGGSGRRDGADTRRGGKGGGYQGSGEGGTGNNYVNKGGSGGGNSGHNSSGGANVSESRSSAGSKSKVSSYRGLSSNVNIETRNRFAALGEN
ncbi:RRM+RGG-containing protein [Cryptosporidium canis]|uniref:RRM+RGG-containing protein n=1 Tax=Cryptosporidium canis TaxID=195482 RepID=A0ABQ8P905_9CRYT|nr:RRM+RGG-containing protein [Cryptosporidium canis]KAJ1614207.1 RRM+RGG-containing protein [Cryptosporidium canis]